MQRAPIYTLYNTYIIYMITFITGFCVTFPNNISLFHPTEPLRCRLAATPDFSVSLSDLRSLWQGVDLQSHVRGSMGGFLLVWFFFADGCVFFLSGFRFM